MTLAATARGTGGNTTAATTLAITPSGNLAAGSLAVIKVALDNQGAGGNTLLAPVSFFDAQGNFWRVRIDAVIDPGAAGAGAELVVYTSRLRFAWTTAQTVTITWLAATSVTAKEWEVWEATASAGNFASWRAAGSATATATLPTITTASLAAGDLVLGFVSAESGTTQTFTGDADTTNGSWSAQQTNKFGSTTTGMGGTSQAKVVTGAGTQTYNPTLGISSDLVIGWIQIREAVRPSDAQGQAVFDDGPDTFHRYTDAAGATTAADTMNGPDATPVGSPTFGEPALAVGGGTSVLLNGSTQHINLPGFFDYGNGPWAYELWWKRSSAAVPATSLPLFAGGLNSGGVSIDNGGVHGHGFVNGFKSGVSNTVHSSSALAADTSIHHTVLAKSAANVWTIYVDGVDVSDRTGDTADTTATTAIAIGFGWDPNSGNHFAGWIGQSATYFYELTSTQVAAHRTAGVAATQAITGSATGTGDASGSAVRIAGLTGAASGLGSASGSESTRAALAVTASGVGSASGGATATLAVSASATGTGAATATIGRLVAITGAATGTGAGAGNAARVTALAGTAAGIGTTSGPVATMTLGLTGSATGVGLANGGAGYLHNLAGTAAGAGVATGAAAATRAIAGTAAGIGSATAAAGIRTQMTGAANGAGTASGSLGPATIPLTGAAAATGTASGSATLRLAATGAAAGSGSATGATTRYARLDGAAPGTGQIAAAAALRLAFATAAVGSGFAAAALNVLAPGPFPGSVGATVGGYTGSVGATSVAQSVGATVGGNTGSVGVGIDAGSVGAVAAARDEANATLG